MPASKNQFVAPQSCDHEIADAKTWEKIGELRVKPSSILWKAKGAHKYHSVPLSDFITWVQQNGSLVDK